MEVPQYVVVISIVIIFGIPEVLRGYLKNTKRTIHDLIMEIGTFALFAALYYPLIGEFTHWALNATLPQYAGALSHLSLWAMFLIFLLIEDGGNYWWHRLTHVHPTLWKLHRAHHSSAEMGVGLIYRNAALYYVFMPSLYLQFALVYLGMWEVYPLYVSLKMLIVTGAHAEIRWDRALYKYKVLAPIAWLLEHTISTPATHYAHHGATDADGISAPNGNFGNFLFFWDLLFGTALITRTYPKEFGLENNPGDPWYAQLLWPILKSPKKGSELA